MNGSSKVRRREFLKTAAVSAATLSVGNLIQASSVDESKRTFKLNYAPHFGMFKNHAGNDPLDQIKFMYEQGFRALEDNGMMGRPKELQEKHNRIKKDLDTIKHRHKH